MTNITAGTLSAHCSPSQQCAGGTNRHVYQAISKVHSLCKLYTFTLADISILRKFWSSSSSVSSSSLQTAISEKLEASGCHPQGVRTPPCSPHRHRFHSLLHRNCFTYHCEWLRGFPCVLPGRPSGLPVQCHVWCYAASQTARLQPENLQTIATKHTKHFIESLGSCLCHV
jgi:hypothetical protein